MQRIPGVGLDNHGFVIIKNAMLNLRIRFQIDFSGIRSQAGNDHIILRGCPVFHRIPHPVFVALFQAKGSKQAVLRLLQCRIQVKAFIRIHCQPAPIARHQPVTLPCHNCTAVAEINVDGAGSVQGATLSQLKGGGFAVDIRAEINGSSVQNQAVIQRGSFSAHPGQHMQCLSGTQRVRYPAANRQLCPLRNAHIAVYGRCCGEFQVPLKRRHIMHHIGSICERLRAGAILHNIQTFRLIPQQCTGIAVIFCSGIDDKRIQRCGDGVTAIG